MTVLIHSWPWKSKQEWLVGTAEKKELSDHIIDLGFNTVKGQNTLVMVSGDLHMMAYDHGGSASNPFGNFPIFQCAPLNKRNSCKAEQIYSTQPQYNNG